MKIRNLPSPGFSFGIAALLIAASQPVLAVEPLADFISAGRKNAYANKAALINTQISDARASESFWKLFPSVGLSGGYTFNPNPVTVNTVINGRLQEVNLYPQNQFDARASLNVTLLDLPAIFRYRAAKAGLSQSQIDQQVAAQQADLMIARGYYTYFAGMNVNAVHAKHVEASTTLVGLAEKRVELGAAQPLEVDRAKIELENIKLAQRETQIAVGAAKRALKDLTGIEAAGGEIAMGEELPEETPLASWQSEATGLPTVKSAQGAIAIADANVTAAKTAYVPKLSFVATDTLSTNSGFQGSPNMFTLGVTASINFDLSMPATVKLQEANRSMARLKADEALTAARELIATAHDQVQLQRTRCASVRYNAAVMRKSAEAAYDRYVRGMSTQEELLRTQQELIVAELAEAKGYAEFLYSRALLRIIAGQDLVRRPLR